MAKFVTSIGCELTFVSTLGEDLMTECEQAKKLAQLKKRPYSDYTETMMTRIHEGVAGVIGQILRARGVAFNNCGTDPGCVEISTNPYTTEATFENAVYGIMKAAGDLYLQSSSDHTGGMGAHIHVGIVGKDAHERGMFARRMMLYAARNPWLTWAFANLADNQNCTPLDVSRVRPRQKPVEETSEDIIEELANERACLAEEELSLHRAATWGDSWSRERRSKNAKYHAAEIRSCLLRLKQARIREANPVEPVDYVKDVMLNTAKAFVFRWTSYSKNGTIEFRCFDMPQEMDPGEILRNAQLANAIVKHVMADTSETVDWSTVYTKEQLKNMRWSERVRGFRRMLEELGFDPADFRVEQYKIAARMRHLRPAKPKPAEVAAPIELPIPDDSLEIPDFEPNPEEPLTAVLPPFQVDAAIESIYPIPDLPGHVSIGFHIDPNSSTTVADFAPVVNDVAANGPEVADNVERFFNTRGNQFAARVARPRNRLRFFAHVEAVNYSSPNYYSIRFRQIGRVSSELRSFTDATADQREFFDDLARNFPNDPVEMPAWITEGSLI